VTPRGGADRIEGFLDRDDGSSALLVRVRAAPDKGAANAAVTVLLAQTFAVSKSCVALIAGETARFKTFRITGDGPVLARHLTEQFSDQA